MSSAANGIGPDSSADRLSWRTLAGRYAAVSVLMLAMLIVAQLQYLALSALVGSAPEDDPLAGGSTGSATGLASRLGAGFSPLVDAVLHFSPDGSRYTFDLKLPRNDSAAAVITSATLDSDATEELSRVALGRVRLGLDWKPSSWTIDPATNSLRVRLTATTPTQRGLFEWDWSQGQGRPGVVTIRLDGVRLDQISVVPKAASEKKLVLALHDTEERWLHVSVADAIAYATEAHAPQDRTPSLQATLVQLSTALEVPGLSPLLRGLIGALPLLILLVWASRRAERGRQLTSVLSLVPALLLIHFAPVVHWQATSVVESLDFWRLIEAIGIPPASKFYIAPYWAIGVVFGVLLPALLRASPWTRREDPSPEGSQLRRWQRFTAPLVWLAAAALAAALVALAALAAHRSPSAVLVSGSIAAACLPALYLLFVATWGCLSRSRVPHASLLLGALLVGLLGAATVSHEGDWIPTTSIAMVALLGGALVYAFVYSIVVNVRSAGTHLTLPTWFAPALWLGAFFSAIPWFGPSDVLREPVFAVGTLGSHMVQWVPLVWLGAVVWVLRDSGRRSPEIPGAMRFVGLLAGAVALFGVSEYWLYLPMSFLLGWLLLSMLVSPPERWEWLAPLLPAVSERRDELLFRLLDLRAAETAQRGIRKALGKKLASGEATGTEYESKIQEQRRYVDSLREQGMVEGQPAREVALRFGPYESAWSNGVYGSAWALLLATPWMGIYLHGYLSSSASGVIYPLWDLLREVVTMGIRWGAFGFMLGYFYPYIRGRHGLHKGLGLFAVWALASVPGAVLHNTDAKEWQATGFLALQVFTHCSLLGLVAFDHTIVRQCRQSLQALLEIHGMAPIGVSISSIFAALGVTLTTLLSSRIGDIITVLVSSVLPEITPQTHSTP